jgi:hypothetical protein
LSVGTVNFVLVDAEPHEDNQEFFDSLPDKLHSNITFVYYAEQDITCTSGIMKAAELCPDTYLSVKLDVDDRLDPFALEKIYREYHKDSTISPGLINGWEIHSESTAVNYEETAKGELFIPRRITTIKDFTESPRKGFQRSSILGNIIAYDISICKLMIPEIKMFTFEQAALDILTLGLNMSTIPSVLGIHTIHSIGLRHGSHNEEAMLSESSQILKMYTNDL